MIHFLTMFLAPDGCVPQATLASPPAEERPARSLGGMKESLRFMAGVLANAAGFGLLLAGCWFSLQLMQAVIHL